MNYVMSTPLPLPGLDAGSSLAELRSRIGRLERGRGAGLPPVLPLGVPTLDRHLPFRGLPLKRLHEIAAAGEREL